MKYFIIAVIFGNDSIILICYVYIYIYIYMQQGFIIFNFCHCEVSIKSITLVWSIILDVIKGYWERKGHRCIEQSFGLWERERVGWFGRMALKHVLYHIKNESPVQVRCRIQDAWGWCTGMTQRDSTAREVRGGFRKGNTCATVADSCWCMAKPIQYCKVNNNNNKEMING